MSQQLQTLVISALLIGGLMTGMLNFAGDVFTSYDTGVTNSDQWSALNDSSSDIQSEQRSYLTQTENQTQGIPRDIEENINFVSAVSTGLTNIYSASNALTTEIGTMLSTTDMIPGWVFILLASLIMTTVVFGIIFNYR